MLSMPPEITMSAEPAVMMSAKTGKVMSVKTLGGEQTYLSVRGADVPVHHFQFSVS